MANLDEITKDTEFVATKPNQPYSLGHSTFDKMNNNMIISGRKCSEVESIRNVLNATINLLDNNLKSNKARLGERNPDTLLWKCLNILNSILIQNNNRTVKNTSNTMFNEPPNAPETEEFSSLETIKPNSYKSRKHTVNRTSDIASKENLESNPIVIENAMICVDTLSQQSLRFINCTLSYENIDLDEIITDRNNIVTKPNQPYSLCQLSIDKINNMIILKKEINEVESIRNVLNASVNLLDHNINNVRLDERNPGLLIWICLNIFNSILIQSNELKEKNTSKTLFYEPLDAPENGKFICLVNIEPNSLTSNKNNRNLTTDVIFEESLESNVINLENALIRVDTLSQQSLRFINHAMCHENIDLDEIITDGNYIVTKPNQPYSLCQLSIDKINNMIISKRKFNEVESIRNVLNASVNLFDHNINNVRLDERNPGLLIWKCLNILNSILIQSNDLNEKNTSKTLFDEPPDAPENEKFICLVNIEPNSLYSNKNERNLTTDVISKESLESNVICLENAMIRVDTLNQQSLRFINHAMCHENIGFDEIITDGNYTVTKPNQPNSFCQLSIDKINMFVSGRKITGVMNHLLDEKVNERDKKPNEIPFNFRIPETLNWKCLNIVNGILMHNFNETVKNAVIRCHEHTALQQYPGVENRSIDNLGLNLPILTPHSDSEDRESYLETQDILAQMHNSYIEVGSRLVETDCNDISIKMNSLDEELLRRNSRKDVPAKSYDPYTKEQQIEDSNLRALHYTETTSISGNKLNLTSSEKQLEERDLTTLLSCNETLGIWEEDCNPTSCDSDAEINPSPNSGKQVVDTQPTALPCTEITSTSEKKLNTNSQVNYDVSGKDFSEISYYEILSENYMPQQDNQINEDPENIADLDTSLDEDIDFDIQDYLKVELNVAYFDDEPCAGDGANIQITNDSAVDLTRNGISSDVKYKGAANNSQSITSCEDIAIRTDFYQNVRSYGRKNGSKELVKAGTGSITRCEDFEITADRYRNVRSYGRKNVSKDLVKEGAESDNRCITRGEDIVITTDRYQTITIDDESDDIPAAVRCKSISNDLLVKNGIESLDVTQSRKRKHGEELDFCTTEAEWQHYKKVLTDKPIRRQFPPTHSDDSASIRLQERIRHLSKPHKEHKERKSRSRRVLPSVNVTQTDQANRGAVNLEIERKQRIKKQNSKLRAVFNVNESETTVVSDDKLVLDYSFETKAPTITVDPLLTKRLKKHQREGVKFMWDACYENLKSVREGKRPGGCILAHSMGSGKSLQIVSLLHTLLTSPETETKTALILCPKSTIWNWVDEWDKWLLDIPTKLKIFSFYKIPRKYHVQQLKDWNSLGGVLIIGFSACSVLRWSKASQSAQEDIEKCLFNPGPDILVCDEGHVLKNNRTEIHAALSQITTKRRIILTGTPIQNSLKEFYHLVDYVKPNLLGTYENFRNEFELKIVNGQHKDSSPEEIENMRVNSDALNKLVDGCLHRAEQSLLDTYIPPKHEFVLMVTMTKPQTELYSYYLNNFCNFYSGKGLINDFKQLNKIWSHPRCLNTNWDDRNAAALEALRRDWWSDIVGSAEELELSNKFLLIFQLLDECQRTNEKMLIFSSSLQALHEVEHFFQKRLGWEKDKQYFCMNGEVKNTDRHISCTKFNDPTQNQDARVFLITKRTGGLGLNLTAASRVVLLDISWNPADDTQCVHRVFRFGQRRPTFVYRLVAAGTMEEQIYRRSVTKESISGRVLDVKQIGRHYCQNELSQIYRFIDTSHYEGNNPIDLTKFADSMLRSLYDRCRDKIISVYEHEDLLRHDSSEELNDHEKRLVQDRLMQYIDNPSSHDVPGDKHSFRTPHLNTTSSTEIFKLNVSSDLDALQITESNSSYVNAYLTSIGRSQFPSEQKKATAVQTRNRQTRTEDDWPLTSAQCVSPSSHSDTSPSKERQHYLNEPHFQSFSSTPNNELCRQKSSVNNDTAYKSSLQSSFSIYQAGIDTLIHSTAQNSNTRNIITNNSHSEEPQMSINTHIDLTSPESTQSTQEPKLTSLPYVYNNHPEYSSTYPYHTSSTNSLYSVTYPKLSSTYSKHSSTYPEPISSFPQYSSTYQQPSSTYPQLSPTYPQLSSTYLQQSLTNPELISTFPRESSSHLQGSSTYSQESQTCAEQSSTYPQHSSMYPQHSLSVGWLAFVQPKPINILQQNATSTKTGLRLDRQNREMNREPRGNPQPTNLLQQNGTSSSPRLSLESRNRQMNKNTREPSKPTDLLQQNAKTQRNAAISCTSGNSQIKTQSRGALQPSNSVQQNTISSTPRLSLESTKRRMNFDPRGAPQPTNSLLQNEISTGLSLESRNRHMNKEPRGITKPINLLQQNAVSSSPQLSLESVKRRMNVDPRGASQPCNSLQQNATSFTPRKSVESRKTQMKADPRNPSQPSNLPQQNATISMPLLSEESRNRQMNTDPRGTLQPTDLLQQNATTFTPRISVESRKRQINAEPGNTSQPSNLPQQNATISMPLLSEESRNRQMSTDPRGTLRPTNLLQQNATSCTSLLSLEGPNRQMNVDPRGIPQPNNLQQTETSRSSVLRLGSPKGHMNVDLRGMPQSSNLPQQNETTSTSRLSSESRNIYSFNNYITQTLSNFMNSNDVNKSSHTIRQSTLKIHYRMFYDKSFVNHLLARCRLSGISDEYFNSVIDECLSRKKHLESGDIYRVAVESFDVSHFNSNWDTLNTLDGILGRGDVHLVNPSPDSTAILSNIVNEVDQNSPLLEDTIESLSNEACENNAEPISSSITEIEQCSPVEIKENSDLSDRYRRNDDLSPSSSVADYEDDCIILDSVTEVEQDDQRNGEVDDGDSDHDEQNSIDMRTNADSPSSAESEIADPESSEESDQRVSKYFLAQSMRKRKSSESSNNKIKLARRTNDSDVSKHSNRKSTIKIFDNTPKKSNTIISAPKASEVITKNMPTKEKTMKMTPKTRDNKATKVVKTKATVQNHVETIKNSSENEKDGVSTSKSMRAESKTNKKTVVDDVENCPLHRKFIADEPFKELLISAMKNDISYASCNDHILDLLSGILIAKIPKEGRITSGEVYNLIKKEYKMEFIKSMWRIYQEANSDTDESCDSSSPTESTENKSKDDLKHRLIDKHTLSKISKYISKRNSYKIKHKIKKMNRCRAEIDHLMSLQSSLNRNVIDLSTNQMSVADIEWLRTNYEIEALEERKLLPLRIKKKESVKESNSLLFSNETRVSSATAVSSAKPNTDAAQNSYSTRKTMTYKPTNITKITKEIRVVLPNMSMEEIESHSSRSRQSVPMKNNKKGSKGYGLSSKLPLGLMRSRLLNEDECMPSTSGQGTLSQSSHHNRSIKESGEPVKATHVSMSERSCEEPFSSSIEMSDDENCDPSSLILISDSEDELQSTILCIDS